MDIIWSRVEHRGEKRIKIEFPFNKALAGVLQREVDARWSKTLKAWHVQDNMENIEKILTLIEHMLEKNQ